MRRLSVFNNVSLDGYFTDAQGKIDWARVDDPEWNAFVNDNSKGESEAIYGRMTHQMMAGWWPTPMALNMFPEVASKMNRMPKVVFSRTLDEVTWSNTRLIKDNLVDEVRAMKAATGPDMIIMGSGTIVSQLTQAGLIDEFQVVIHPVVLGAGRTMFEGAQARFARTRERSFANGCVVLWYEPRA